jgi:diguanylate cyclase (GGDEF)-like protein/PAS domain S-box-containing protein
MEHRNQKIKNLKHISTGLSALVVLFGLSVILGLYNHIEGLYRYEPDTVAMVFNTALSFTVIGIVMLACIYKYCYAAGALVFIVALNAVLVLIQHIYGADMGVDQLFFEHLDSHDNAYPGRMAPNTAVCFLLASVAMLCQNHLCNNKTIIGIGCTLSMLVLTFGIVFAAGYINPTLDTFFWGTQTPMSKSAAVGFIILGFALLSISFYHSVLKSIYLMRYIPVALSICISAATLMLVNEIYAELLLKEASISIVIVTLGFGILLAIACGLFLHFMILSLEMQGKLSDSQAILQSTLDSSIEGIVVVSTDGKIIAYNSRFLEMWGVPNNDKSIINRRMLTKIVVARLLNREEYYLKRRQLVTNLGYEGSDFLELSNGSIYERHIMPHIVDGNITGRVFSYRDITAQKHLEKELLHQSTYDPLTGLPNRSLMIDLIRRAINAPGSKVHKLAIFIIDVDKFAVINDLFGRTKGDDVIKMIALRLQRELSENCVLGRIGGDEFLVLSTDLSVPETAVRLIRKIILAFEEPFDLQGNNVPVTMCTGIAVYPKDGETVDELLANADIALLRAKVQGRNSFQFYTDSMNKYTIKHMEMETRLRKAIIDKKFVVYYQPIFDLESFKIAAVEALVRLADDVSELVPPNDFIPLAESLGLIMQIGEFVLLDACKQAKAWHDAGFNDLVLAVNISANQFKFSSIAKNIEDVVKTTGINPTKLELELTESAFFNTSEVVAESLNQIASLGIRLSIDDFGTGFSSFNYVKRFSINKIKIDQSFIKDAVNNEQDRIIVGAMVAMGKNLRFTMLAEGIETEEQQDLVTKLGCTQGQGFLFAKPMTAAEFTKFLKHPPSIRNPVNK